MKTKFNGVKTLLFGSLILTGLVLNSSLSAQAENRDIGDFNRIGYSISGQLEISQGNRTKLQLEGSAGDLRHVITRVENGELRIYKKNNTHQIRNVIIRLTVEDLEALSVSGSGSVSFKTGLNTDDFRFRLSGSGKVKCSNISGQKLRINVSGSGNLLLGGKCEESIKVSISGSGQVNAKELVVPRAEAHISGSGKARLHVTKELITRISGSGTVYYKGNPLVDARSSGSGKTIAL